MPFKIIRNDITKVKADIIVNTANPKPVVGGGTDSAVYRAAGEKELLAERIRIGDILPGQAAVTPAFGLPARYIIHTVGPVWEDGDHGERDILRSCYENSLSLAAEHGAESIAFPLIATGVYGFPKDEALSIALSVIGKFLLTHDMKVILAVFDRKAFELSNSLMGEIDEYIDENGVGLAIRSEYGFYDEREHNRRLRNARMRSDVSFAENKAETLDCVFSEPTPSEPPKASKINDKSLDEVLSGAGETFQQRLFRLIDESGMDDVTVYKKANIDRKVFSRIRCKADYKPKKTTAIAFAIALKLDMPAMTDLLARAEIAFSPSNKSDLIIQYFVTHGIYDIYEINAALFKYLEKILGE
ncbi:MAG: macro domain-containing protein [Oscillospiraceae bacterium]|nr:macro domain-containing protein [Oscillospiraceae bacterium]